MSMREQWMQHLFERKHLAFQRWIASGYADIPAWQEYIRLFNLGIKHNGK